MERSVLMGFLDKLRADHATPDKVIDPVCHMTIDPKTAAGTSEHAGQKYWFCAASCKKKFDADPHKYLGAHSH